MNKPYCLAAVAFVAVSSTIATAQPAPTFEKGKVDDVKDVKDVTWTAKGEAGVLASTGNSKSTTLSAGASATRKDKDNKLEVVFAAAYARATTRTANDANGNMVIDPGELATAEATSVKNAAAKLRYDRYLTELDSLYVAALGAVDSPAGKEFEGGGQVGYSRSVYKDGAPGRSRLASTCPEPRSSSRSGGARPMPPRAVSTSSRWCSASSGGSRSAREGNNSR